MSVRSDRTWRAAAILLAIALGVVLICTALIVTGVMNLGVSFL
jgi:hypothetical protein